MAAVGDHLPREPHAHPPRARLHGWPIISRLLSIGTMATLPRSECDMKAANIRRGVQMTGGTGKSRLRRPGEGSLPTVSLEARRGGGRGRTGRGLSRVVFEPVVEVGVPAARNRPHAGGDVSRQKQRSQALVLPHVCSLVRPCPFKGFGITTKNDVAKCDRGDTSPDQSEVSQSPAEEPSVRFDDAVNSSDTSSPQRQRGEYQADHGCRCGPQITKQHLPGDCIN